MNEQLRGSKREHNGAVVYQLGSYIMAHLEHLEGGRTYHTGSEVEHLVRINNVYARRKLPLLPEHDTKPATKIALSSLRKPHMTAVSEVESFDEYADLEGDER